MHGVIGPTLACALAAWTELFIVLARGDSTGLVTRRILVQFSEPTIVQVMNLLAPRATSNDWYNQRGWRCCAPRWRGRGR